MTEHRFRIVNVFTREATGLSGNPLCVFENGAGFDDAAMLALARQFNLSETTFLLPSVTADARVRIFTPAYEMPFAGHPTLGTAHVCRALGMAGDSLRLEMRAGVIPVQATGDRWTLVPPTPTVRELDAPLPVLADALGLEEADIGERPLWVKAGKEQLIVPLRTAAAVQRAVPRPAAFAGIPSEDGMGMAYIFAQTGAQRTVARFFFPQGSAMLEDPATGSATANFGGWCLAMQQPLPLRFQIDQGDLVARPSTLFLEISTERQIRVSGYVVDVASGCVTLT